MGDLLPNMKDLVGQITKNSQECDITCQINKKYTNMVKAEQNLAKAPDELKEAERDYYTLKEGTQFYSNREENKYKKIVDEEIKEENVKLLQIWNDIDNKLDYYKSVFSYSGNVQDVYDSYNDKYTDLVNEIQETTDKKNIDYRLAHFYNYNTTVVNYILYYLKIIYWIFYTVLLIIFVFKKHYRNIKTWPFIILVPLFPLLFEWGISFKNPFKKEEVVIPSVHDYIFQIFKHAKIDNIYFIFFTLIILTLILFSFFSELPFINKSISV